ncbi:DUF669 domain-containing protein [Gelria sp. Kuro-4]|uniref:DUF669 domain-containing protein n=1 Tax=Gelria sp. Kuro-4 TaxID=2796927 RepID=UPI001BEF0C63|nr:DUF669 domain-containing protein [Gelria sp. Kuro-4]BCV23330.1 hypothetical protein kuro4_01030 [Gelria sp. Kuro-4]
MPKLLLDFNDVDLEGGFTPVPAGIYEARIDTSEVEVKTSQNGNAYVTLVFVIENHPEFTGHKVFENFMIRGKGAWKMGRLLKTLGLLPTDAISFPFDTAELHNKRCKIKVKQETYEDKLRNRVDAFMPLDSAAGAAGAAKKKISF